MRKIFIAILLITFVLMPSLTQAANDRWIWMFSDDRTGCFFDSATISPSENSRNIFEVWIKQQHTPAYAQEIVRKAGLDEEIYKDFSYQVTLIRFDINNKKMATMSNILYTTNGDVLYNYSVKEYMIEWDNIIPSSNGEIWFIITKEYYLSKY